MAPDTGARLAGLTLVCLGRARLVEVFKFMTANQAEYPVQLIAKVMGVSRSGFLCLAAPRAVHAGCRRCGAERTDCGEPHCVQADLWRAEDPH